MIKIRVTLKQLSLPIYIPLAVIQSSICVFQLYNTQDNIYGAGESTDKVGTNLINIDIRNATDNKPLQFKSFSDNQKVDLFLTVKGERLNPILLLISAELQMLPKVTKK